MYFINDYLAELISTLNKLPLDRIERIKDTLLQAHSDHRHIFIMGNGGSAATSSHFACDLAMGDFCNRERFKVIALTDNVFLLTAWANDTGYENVFVEQLRNLLKKDDVVIAISASGNSENALRAVEYANSRGAVTVGLTGFDGGKLKGIAKVCLVVPSDSMERVEDVHLILGHLLSCYLREVLK